MIGYITLALAAVYAVYLIRLSRSIPGNRSASVSVSGQEKITVIVPFRNEEKVLEELLVCLEKQEYQGSWEIILADDHSDDVSSRIAQEHALRNTRAVYLKVSGEGKKQALREAIANSTGQIIVTIDADIRVDRKWLSSVWSAFAGKPTEMAVLPVMLDRASGLAGKLEQLEFLSVSAVTAGAIGLGKPVMCNGANLAFRKSAFENLHIKDLRDDLASGDDMFLMISIARKNASHIIYLSDPDAIARTPVMEHPVKLLRQRVRWASKISAMNYAPIIMAGAIVGLFHLAIVLSVLSGSSPWLWGSAWIAKAICDFLLVWRMNKLFRTDIRPDVFLVLEILHPFYSVFVPLVGIVWKPSWKGRKITGKAV